MTTGNREIVVDLQALRPLSCPWTRGPGTP